MTVTASAAAHAPARAADTGDAAEVMILASAFSLGLLLVINLLASAGLVFGAPLGPWLLPLALGLAGAAAFRLQATATRATLLFTLGLTATLWLGAVLLAGSVYDWSWDGQHYHQELILQLSAGWNPVWQTFRPEERGIVDGEIALWLNHYPRGLAVPGVAIYTLTGALETAKFINPLLMALTGLYAAALLRRFAELSWLWSGLLGAALATNAIAAAQLLSFYNDGALFCGVALIMLTGAHFLARPGAVPLIALAGAVFLTATIKFTGLAFAIATLGFLGMVALYRAGGRIPDVLPLAGLFAGLLCLALIAVGPSSYLQNLWGGGHPLYPLMGENAFDIISRSKPKVFLELSGPESLFASLIGAPQISVAGYETRGPFSLFGPEQLKVLSWVDPRIGGWGPVFAEQLVIALIGAAALLAFARDKWTALLGAFGLGATLLLALLHPEAWWARYSSFLLIGPWCVFAAAAALGHGWTRLFAAFGLALMFANNLPVFWTATVKAYEVNARTAEQVGYIKASPGPVTLSVGLFHANRAKLQEAGIEATIVPRAEDLPCKDPIPFYNGHWISQACY